MELSLKYIVNVYFNIAGSKLCKYYKDKENHSIILQVMIEKENNFKQPGERYRSWDTARSCLTLDIDIHWKVQ
jgi:hypothetical protein